MAATYPSGESARSHAGSRKGAAVVGMGAGAVMVMDPPGRYAATVGAGRGRGHRRNRLFRGIPPRASLRSIAAVGHNVAMDIADRRGLAVRSPRVAVVSAFAVGFAALLVMGVADRPSDAAPVPMWVLAAMLACGVGIAVLSARFVDAARWRLGLTLGVLSMAYAPIFATASLAPRAPIATIVTTAATWWQIPVILVSQLLVLQCVARATGRSVRRVSLVVIGGDAGVARPPTHRRAGARHGNPVVHRRRLSGRRRLPRDGRRLAAAVDCRGADNAADGMVAGRSDVSRRAGSAAIVAVAAVSPLVMLVVCGALVVVTTLDAVPHALTYPILGLGLPVAVLSSVLLVRGPDDPRFRRGALISFAVTAAARERADGGLRGGRRGSDGRHRERARRARHLHRAGRGIRSGAPLGAGRSGIRHRAAPGGCPQQGSAPRRLRRPRSRGWDRSPRGSARCSTCSRRASATRESPAASRHPRGRSMRMCARSSSSSGRLRIPTRISGCGLRCDG